MRVGVGVSCVVEVWWCGVVNAWSAVCVVRCWGRVGWWGECIKTEEEAMTEEERRCCFVVDAL